MKRRRWTPKVALLATTVLIFVGEMIVMLVLDFFQLSWPSVHLFDAMLLTLLISAPLYFLLFRPFINGKRPRNRTVDTARMGQRGTARPPHLRSPLATFLLTGGTIFLGEVIVMLALDKVDALSLSVVPVIDAALLAFLTFPALYFVLFRPLTNATTQHWATANRLHQTKEQLEAAARDWRVTFDSVQSPVLVIDVNGQIHRVNRAARELAAKPYRELVGASVASVRPGGIWQAVADLIPELLEAGSPMVRSFHDESDGRTWDIAASLAASPGADDERVTVIARDITHLSRLQESLRRSENMAAMGNLIGGVAHEVRNPLFGMLATLDALEVGLTSTDDASQYLKVLRQEAGRLTELMQDLMEYGRPVELDIGSGSIGAVINSAIEECEPVARKVGVKLVSRLAEQRVRIQMDSRRLRQVFQNLAMNAIPYSPSPGVVELAAQDFRRGDEVWVQCTVTDGGPGIAPEDLQRIFEPFFSRRTGGTGLGLSVVQRIVEQHGGSVYAGNRPEGGTVITLRLPSTPPETAAVS
jgi:PAS domain S-box-containing protein